MYVLYYFLLAPIIYPTEDSLFRQAIPCPLLVNSPGLTIQIFILPSFDLDTNAEANRLYYGSLMPWI